MIRDDPAIGGTNWAAKSLGKHFGRPNMSRHFKLKIYEPWITSNIIKRSVSIWVVYSVDPFRTHFTLTSLVSCRSGQVAFSYSPGCRNVGIRSAKCIVRRLLCKLPMWQTAEAEDFTGHCQIAMKPAMGSCHMPCTW